jgi:uncharacterized protein (TIGR02452 family)
MSSRSRNAEIARETLAILDAGGYVAEGGRRVDLSPDLRRSVEATALYRPGDFPPDPAPPADSPRLGSTIEVTGETTLEAARRLSTTFDVEPMCLNFASARNPGGGFLKGAHAQEESLARSSGLFPCLEAAREYYDHHRAERSTLYSDHMILSPGVPVFRDDDGRLLDTPYRATFVTSPAVNAGAYLRDRPRGRPLLVSTMRGRLARVLWLAHRHGQTHLVLGAWGCGVFANDPEMVAGLFRDALGAGGPFSGIFPHITFAVFDPSPTRMTHRAFRAALDPAE